MMTRQDYIAIADILRRERERATMSAATQAVASITRSLADLMAAENPNFDRERFFNAAGMWKGRS